MALGGELDVALVQVEGAAGPQINTAAEAVHLLVGRGDLGDFDGAERVGGNHIKRERAVAAIGRGDADAVQLHRVQVGPNPAHDDEAALALIAIERDARDALHRLGGVLIGEATDFVGGDEVGQRLGGALLVDGARGAHGVAGDDKLVQRDDLGAEARIEARGGAGGDGHGLAQVGVAHVGELHGLSTGGDVEEHIVAALIRDGRECGACDVHLRAAERQLGLRVGHAAGDRAGRLRERGDIEEEADGDGPQYAQPAAARDGRG